MQRVVCEHDYIYILMLTYQDMIRMGYETAKACKRQGQPADASVEANGVTPSVLMSRVKTSPDMINSFLYMFPNL